MVEAAEAAEVAGTKEYNGCNGIDSEETEEAEVKLKVVKVKPLNNNKKAVSTTNKRSRIM